MEKLLSILKEINSDVDFENENELVDSGLLDSLDIVNIIGAIEESYGIMIDPEDIDPDNFQSIGAIYELINNTTNKRSSTNRNLQDNIYRP